MSKISTYYDRHKCDGLFNDQPSRTKQEFAAEADINNVVERYIKTGSWGEATGLRQPQYGEFDNEMDFRDLQNRILDARNDFAVLPAKVRDRFGNDVANLIDYLADDRNHEEARKLGILPMLEHTPPPTSKAPEEPLNDESDDDSSTSDQPSS